MDMPDKDLAAEERPIPSQAEGSDEPEELEDANRPVPSQAEGDSDKADDVSRKK